MGVKSSGGSFTVCDRSVRSGAGFGGMLGAGGGRGCDCDSGGAALGVGADGGRGADCVVDVEAGALCVDDVDVGAVDGRAVRWMR